jgi:hypothetical protein
MRTPLIRDHAVIPPSANGRGLILAVVMNVLLIILIGYYYTYLQPLGMPAMHLIE